MPLVLDQDIVASGTPLMDCKVYRMEHAATMSHASCTVWLGDEPPIGTQGINSPDQYCYKVVLQNLTNNHFFNVQLRFIWEVTSRPVPPPTIPWTNCDLLSYVELFSPVAERVISPFEHSDCCLLGFNHLGPSPARVVSAVTVNVSNSMQPTSTFRVRIRDCYYRIGSMQMVLQSEGHITLPAAFRINETVVS